MARTGKNRSGEEGQPLTIQAEGVRSPAELVGTEDPRLAQRLVNQVADTLWLPEALSERERVERITAAVSALKGIGPRDTMEGLLAAQMVATHGAAMDCLRRAMEAEENPLVRDADLRQAQRLLALYAKQVETLNRGRGKATQRVTVEHVRVESGGQAIVGAVGTEGP